MKASCIIPVYNAEDTLRRCVESILYGKERDIEIILIDDCSKDGSWNLCQSLSREYSNVISVQNERNSGVSYTRNHGLSLAHGEYIFFVDSDDWVSADYTAALLKTAEDFPSSLVISGYCLCDFISQTDTIYILDSEKTTSLVPDTKYYKLVDAVLIQSLWNKVFHRDVITQSKILFDEKQSMGEDLQFVLDYMKAAQVTSCLVLNVPLYYYVRANRTSLMSRLGVSGFDASASRLKQLAALGNTGDSILEKQLASLKQNYLYHISRYHGFNHQQKLENIELVMQDGRSKQHYAKQRRIMLVESLYGLKDSLKTFSIRCRGKLEREKRARLIRTSCQPVQSENFTIISQNCIGGVFYHDLGMQFLSPTVNLFIKACDFSRFVLNLRTYLDMELEMHWLEKYPIGILGDITIYFQHYSSCSEAKAVWEKRVARINWDKILVLSTDHEGFNKETYQIWKQIPYPKVLFTAQEEFKDDEAVVYFPEYKSAGCVPDLIPKREFYKDNILIQVTNQL